MHSSVIQTPLHLYHRMPNSIADTVFRVTCSPSPHDPPTLSLRLPPLPPTLHLPPQPQPLQLRPPRVLLHRHRAKIPLQTHLWLEPLLAFRPLLQCLQIGSFGGETAIAAVLLLLCFCLWSGRAGARRGGGIIEVDDRCRGGRCGCGVLRGGEEMSPFGFLRGARSGWLLVCDGCHDVKSALCEASGAAYRAIDRYLCDKKIGREDG